MPKPLPVPDNDTEPVRILLVIIDPVLMGHANRRLSTVLGWNNPDLLVDGFINDLQEVSHGYARYVIVERLLDDEFPIKGDGFQYTEEEYLRVYRAHRGFHQPDAIDYHHILQKYQVIEKINQNYIDEVWTVSFPWAGFYESRMAGPGAFWCNSPPLDHADRATRRFIIMAFNYERGLGEMLESYGHRAEAIMAHVFRGIPASKNFWELYTRHEKNNPGRAEVGSIHFAPNSRQDYDWGNLTPVLSGCRNWYRFPDLTAEPQWVNCNEWGNGDIRKHHKWWFSLMPHIEGQSNNISYNWWYYIVNPNNIL